MPLTPGTRLGPYEILGPIGAGGMGEVHRARHLKLDRDVAIKVLPPQLADDPERLARLEREARAASALNHPNIVTIYDIGEHGGTTYIAMELVEGRTLQELAAGEPMPVDEVLDLASQIADGLAKAHAAGVLHRDIKPANLMVTGDGLVKILDFGLAKPLTTGAGSDEPGAAGKSEIPASRVTTDTAAGTLLGTPRYMSPEQLSEGRVDHRSDQFAFGVTLYEILTGELPFEGTSLPAVVTAILTRPAPPVRDVRKDVPSDLAEIIERCLEKDPDDRFASMAELGAELSRLVQRRQRARHGLVAKLKRPAVGVPVAVMVSALLAGAALWVSGAERRWAEEEAMAEITDLIETGELYGAYRTVLQAEEHRPDDPEIAPRLAWIRHEHQALAHWGGRGAVDVHAFDQDLGALLLERVIPGERMLDSELPADGRARAFADVFGALSSSPAPPDVGLPSIGSWLEALEVAPGAPHGLTEEGATAALLAEELLNASTRSVVLHGDLHPGNLLRDRSGGWVAIDPKGVVGPPEAGAAAFLRNPRDALLAHADPEGLILDRASVIAARAGYDRGALLRWGYVLAVAAAAWAHEDGEPLHEHEGWLRCAAVMKSGLER